MEEDGTGAAAPLPMEGDTSAAADVVPEVNTRQLKDKHGELNDLIQKLSIKTSSVITKQERDFLAAYRSHMHFVQEELEGLRKQVAEAETNLQQNAEVAKLEEERDWYKAEALRLDSLATAMKKDLRYLKERHVALGCQKTYLAKQLKMAMKRNKLITAEIGIHAQAHSHAHAQVEEDARQQREQKEFEQRKLAETGRARRAAAAAAATAADAMRKHRHHESAPNLALQQNGNTDRRGNGTRAHSADPEMENALQARRLEEFTRVVQSLDATMQSEQARISDLEDELDRLHTVTQGPMPLRNNSNLNKHPSAQFAPAVPRDGHLVTAATRAQAEAEACVLSAIVAVRQEHVRKRGVEGALRTKSRHVVQATADHVSGVASSGQDLDAAGEPQRQFSSGSFSHDDVDGAGFTGTNLVADDTWNKGGVSGLGLEDLTAADRFTILQRVLMNPRQFRALVAEFAVDPLPGQERTSSPTNRAAEHQDTAEESLEESIARSRAVFESRR